MKDPYPKLGINLQEMARPIQSTPELSGEDARRLLESLERTCSLEEAERRRNRAKNAWDLLTRPKLPKPGEG